MNEGGQSVAGAAIDHLLRLHPAHDAATAQAHAQGRALPEWLADAALSQADRGEAILHGSALLHVVPEFRAAARPSPTPRPAP